jgi:hypothetical protein
LVRAHDKGARTRDLSPANPARTVAGRSMPGGRRRVCQHAHTSVCACAYVPPGQQGDLYSSLPCPSVGPRRLPRTVEEPLQLAALRPSVRANPSGQKTENPRAAPMQKGCDALGLLPPGSSMYRQPPPIFVRGRHYSLFLPLPLDRSPARPQKTCDVI